MQNYVRLCDAALKLGVKVELCVGALHKMKLAAGVVVQCRVPNELRLVHTGGRLLATVRVNGLRDLNRAAGELLSSVAK